MTLKNRPDSAEPGASGAPILTIVRRYWWISALVLLLVALGAGGRYLTAPQSYVATQGFTVALIPAQALGNPGDAALAMSGAQAVAHAIATSDAVTAPAFADAVLAKIPADTTQRENITKAQIQKALSATDQEAQVKLEARWSTASGARAIVSAAVLALQANPQIPAYALNPGDSISVQVPSSAPLVEQDSERQAENLTTLLQQLTIGLGIALLLPWIFAALNGMRRPGV
jgi:hypothetical protein